ncbi:MAG: CBS domain-containing protein/gamma-glutamyl:cysteine ligase YbdK (ATP-grasp superfamily) [Flavobacteriaceae bacterium]|jgi:CBS domain-containing protein/gamma-glutamyl:cysteine ligase YbdK (ATP-grasp superfamily)
MGDQKINTITEKKSRTKFIRHLLNDIKSLEYMLENGLIESGITRIGSEQEFCLINKNWRPSKKSDKILQDVNDPHFTTEIALFNLEINLDPQDLKTDAFSKVEKQLKTLLEKAKVSAEKFNNKVILTGILPTISKKELQFNYMTPQPRYWMLNDMLKNLRGKDFRLHIRGVDELFIKHDSVLFEGCNTSFQMHLQIDPDDFISSYNWSQAISGPLLGLCTNSPLLLGRELWSETRIALFQQSIDTRNTSHALIDKQSRVSFTKEWATGSVIDIFKNDIANHKIIFSKDIKNDSKQDLKEGKTPNLDALCTFNGTVYRWNRPCYGVGNGKAHLRIENRYIPAGPTVIDEMANFAFWVGLMKGRPSKYDDMPSQMDFKDAKSNFVKAARTGKESVMVWMGEKISVRDLILNKLLPIAKDGLKKEGIDQVDIDRFLGVIEERAKSLTGSQWKLKNYRHLRKYLKQDEALMTLTKAIYNNQQGDLAVHEWPMIKNIPKIYQDAHLVNHVMSTKLHTIDENDLTELASEIMDWKKIHHLPVENEKGELVGLITWAQIEEFKKSKSFKNDSIVADVMMKNVYIVHPETKILEALHHMKTNNVSCLPVVQKNSLVGIITIKDIIT